MLRRNVRTNAEHPARPAIAGPTPPRPDRRERPFVAPPRPEFRPARSRSDRILLGVAGGLAHQLGLDPILIRLSFVVLTAAGGFGIVAYVVLALLARKEPEPVRASASRAAEPRLIAGLACVLAGMLLLLRQVGVWFGDPVVGSVSMVAAGSGLIWGGVRRNSAGRWRQMVRVVRFVGGVGLVLGGMAVLLRASTALAAARAVVFAILVTAAVIVLVFGPWIWRLARQLAEERRARIRSQERADVAAHLHDSVLQTLALIQRTKDPRRMTSLARTQERELRAWLYGRAMADGQTGEVLSVALDQVAARAEELLLVPVEVVVVGECPLDQRLTAVVEAAGEAVQNAARHSGAASVSVYAEVQPDLVRVYVRDEGRGFSPEEVPEDRRGIAESIKGRMRRNGGSVTIVTAPMEGTEVRLRMPRGPV